MFMIPEGATQYICSEEENTHTSYEAAAAELALVGYVGLGTRPR